MNNNIRDFLIKYKGTIVKLHGNDAIEIHGYLNEVYDNGFIKLHKPIITADRIQFNYSGILSQIIKLEYENRVEGDTLTIPLAPIYNNDATNKSIILNVNNFILVPLYEPKIFNFSDDIDDINIKRQKSLSQVMIDYIDYVYDEFMKKIQQEVQKK